MLAPTRELALQISQSFNHYGRKLSLSHTTFWRDGHFQKALFPETSFDTLSLYDRAIIDVMIKSKGHVKSKIW